jgi:hypothetical protein
MPCLHKSYLSHGSYWSYCFLALLLATGAAFGAQPAARKFLPETAVLDRVDGRLLHADANDTWLLELTTEVKTPEYRLPTGARFVLLPSGTLSQLVADVNDRVAPRYRLSARVTLYRGKNYLLPFYYLPLSKFKDDKSPEDGEQKTEDSGANRKSKIENQKSEGSELVIPPEVLERLQKQRPLRGPRRSTERKPIPAAAEQVLVDCVGRIENAPRSPERRDQDYIFVPYGLGWNISDVRYNLLPCTALEEALRRQKGALDPIRFNVAGLVTEFQGKKYLLLQRAIVVYNYGNFGR